MNERYKKIVYYLLIAAGIALGLFLIFKYALPLFLPFVLAWIIAAMLQPIIRFLDSKVKIPKKVSVLVLVVTVIGLLVWAIYAIANKLVTEVTSLVSFLKQWMQNITNNDSAVNDIIDRLNNAIPFIDFSDKLYEIWDNLDGYILDAIKHLSGNITNIIPILTDIVMMIPGGVVFFVISVISCFYFACDFEKINTFLAMQLPVRVRAFGTVLKQQFLVTIGKYIRAYGLIMLITFTELFVGLSILGTSYSFLLAFITALIDIIPVLGTGLVLIPWAFYSLIVGDYFMFVGLLILYVLITVIRQIIEPKIVGSYIGLYPLVTLIAMYVGTKVMGVFGLFLFPITMIMLKKLNDEGHIKLWKRLPEEEEPKIPKRRRIYLRIGQKIKKEKEKRAAAKGADNDKK